MAKNDQPNMLIVIAGIVLLILFFNKTGFIGTLVTTCENVEPVSLTEFISIMDEKNGTVDQIEPFTFMEESGLVGLPTYKTTSDLGVIDVIDLQGRACNDILAIVFSTEDNTEYVTLNQRQVLLTDEGYLWCNNQNNLGLRTTSVSAFSNYYDEFEICISQEVSDLIEADVTDEDTCVALDGNWTGVACYCGDRRMKITDTACTLYQPREEDSDDSSGSTGSSSSGTTTVGSTTTTTTTTQPRQDEEYSTQQIVAIIGIISIVVFGAYWFLEKGPDKGLIKRRRKKRK